MSSTGFSLAGTRALAAVRLRRASFNWLTGLIAIGIIAAAGGFSWTFNDYFPLAAVSIALFLSAHIIDLFIKQCLENEKLPIQSDNAADHLSKNLVRILHKYKNPNSGDVLRAAMKSKRGKFILNELGITEVILLERCKHECEEGIEVESFMNEAMLLLPKLNETRIDGNIILFLLLQQTPCGKQLLLDTDISDEDLQGLVRWEHVHYHFKTHDNGLSPDSIRHNMSLGRSWVMGYTDDLDALTSEVRFNQTHNGERGVVIHKDSIEAVMSVLSRSSQRNILLLGKHGVGKETLTKNLAAALRAFEKKNHKSFTRVLELHTEKLLSGVGDPARFFLQAMTRAQHSGHFILVIRNLAQLLKAADATLKTVLIRCLESSNITIIGIADTQDYHTVIKTDSGFDNLFEKITVEDATDEETMSVLMAHYFTLERKSVRITYKALKSILELSKRYLGSLAGYPGKAMEIMDDAILRTAKQKDGYVTEEHVRAVISSIGRVNVQSVTQDERDRLLNLEERLKARIIDQDTAVKAVSGALKRARLDLSERKRPIGTFLFLGPTGVGKTQTAKALATEYFGSPDAMIRLDMNEYSHADSVFNIIGSSHAEGFLSQRVQDKPFSLILLDEIEKAHPSVLNLFLQILDEGLLNDGRGMKTDFRNTIIIATSNAGALFIRDFVRDHENLDKEMFKKAVVETIIQEKMFSPEFINRFDEVVLFHPLSPQGAEKVALLMLDEIISDVSERRGISIKVEEGVIQKLVERGHSIEFGARAMRRTITETIENYLADTMLRNNTKRGQEIVIRETDIA